MRWTLFIVAILSGACLGAEWWEEELQEVEQAREGGPLQAAVGRALWTKGYVEVVGEATCDPAEALSEAHCYVMARRAAIVLAQEKLSETVNGIVVDGETVLRNELLASSALRTKTQGLVKGAQVVHEDRVTLPDGSVLARVWMRLPLYGEGGLAGPILEHAAAKAAERPIPRFVVPSPPPPTERFTGIIVNASGIQAAPAQAPKLLVLEELKAALSIDQVDVSVARQIGMVEYASSLDDALSLVDRVGPHPLILTAVAAHGTTKCDLVISAGDGIRLASADPDGALVRSCKVVFVGSFI